MRVCSIALLALAGCAPPARYDTLIADYHRDVHPDGDTALAALTAAPALDRGALVRAVIARNPGITAMREAWRAALADVRAAGAFADPMLAYELSPLSIGSARLGQRVELRQKLPFPGKQAADGDAALADAAAAHDDLRATTLELAELASTLYDDDALVEQELAVNAHHRTIAEQIKRAAEAQLAAGRGTTQDALAADLELGRMAQEQLVLESERAQTIARLDGLLHRDPDAALPAPAADPIAPVEPPPLAELERAAAERPDAAAATERIAGRAAHVASAERAFYPDLELMGAYDAMWDAPEQRWIVGVAIDVPLQRGKRDADVDTARARLAQATAERDRLRDDVRVEVFRARREVVASNALVRSFDERVLPAARAQVDAALQGFASGRNDVTAVITAERSAREVELAAFRARAELAKHRAALDRITGRMPGGGAP